MNNLYHGKFYGKRTLDKIMNPPPTIIEKWTSWWSRVSGDKMFWLTLIALIYLSIMLAWAIVSI